VPLEEHLGELPEILARDLDVDTLVFHSRVEFGANANWKVVVENFLECYHCPTAHPAFSADVDVSPDRYLLEPHPTFGAQFCRSRQTGERGQFHLLYPNTGLNVFPGPPNLSIGPIAPHGPHRTQRYLDYFFARTSTNAGCGSSSRSTTRSAARTRRWSSRCSAGWRAGCSTTAACWSTPSRCSLRSRAGCEAR
jgi:Ring hydroxylating alpha subunit (catalytic domain).